MKKLLIILLLIVGCDVLQEEDVYGCTDANASNFDSNANIFDNSCEYSVISDFTDFETIQGMDANGSIASADEINKAETRSRLDVDEDTATASA